MDTIDPNVTGRRRHHATERHKKPKRPLWPSRTVCEFFADIVPRSLHRWKNDPTLNFPQPIRINGRDYYVPDEIEAFALKRRAIAGHEAKMAAESKPAVEAQPKTKAKTAKPELIPAEKPARRRPRKDRAAASVENEVI
jgi:hypothetical protein